jgi:hypothetical protein
MCFKCLGIQSFVTKATHSNIVIYNFCTNKTVSNSECERVREIMMMFAN